VVEAENQALRKRADADGSLFDLPADHLSQISEKWLGKDAVRDIAQTIAGNVSREAETRQVG